jgi:protein-L-isoaspartate(D-aspartate) O-methyltransferase
MNLIEELILKKVINNPELIVAFRKIKRENFLTPDCKRLAEKDNPLPIGFSQTNSQPSTVALMMESLEPRKGLKILDVGCGSGWTTAILAEVVGSDGKVYGIDVIEELAEFAINNLNKYELIKKGIVQIFCTDGYKGLIRFAPFDRILVSAASESIPHELMRQLAVGGIMVIPIGLQGYSQDLHILKKLEHDRFEERIIPGFSFVPLVQKIE